MLGFGSVWWSGARLLRGWCTSLYADVFFVKRRVVIRNGLFLFYNPAPPLSTIFWEFSVWVSMRDFLGHTLCCDFILTVRGFEMLAKCFGSCQLGRCDPMLDVPTLPAW
jgi:hypothetical protein